MGPAESMALVAFLAMVPLWISVGIMVKNDLKQQKKEQAGQQYEGEIW